MFEDVHWIDSETQAVLDRLVDALAATRLCLLVTYRPEYQHQWGGKACYTQLRLDPLSPTSAGELLRDLVGEHASLQPLKRLLLDRTQGNPFFLEESLQTLVETQVLGGDRGAYYLARDLPQVQVPASVQAVLGSRVDRLPVEDKRVLQTAAVIGMELPVPLLQAIAEVPEDALHRSLAHLQAAEFLYETRLFPEREYTFKHALTHEVAYSSLLQDRRRTLHAHIVAALDELYAARLTEQVDRLAHHALRGEVWDKALTYSRQAGEKVLARSAHREAVAYFEQALSALSHLPETGATCEQAIDLRLALRTALNVGDVSGSDFERTLVYLREAETLAVTLDDPHRLAEVSNFLSRHFSFMGAHDQAIAAAQRALALAPAGGHIAPRARAIQRLGMIALWQGNYHQAIDYLGQTVACLDGAQRRERFGTSTVVAASSCAWLAWCHAELGLFIEGAAFGDEGLRIAEAVEHPASLLVASWGSGLLALRQGNLPRALASLERAMGICQDADLPTFFPRVAAPLGAAYVLAGRVPDAVALLLSIMEQAMAMETVEFQIPFDLTVGETQLLTGHVGRHTLSPQVRWRSPVGARNVAIRRMPCACSGRSPRDASLLLSNRARPTISRPSPWPRTSACARFRPTATAAWGSSISGLDGATTLAPSYPLRSSCTARWT